MFCDVTLSFMVIEIFQPLPHKFKVSRKACWESETSNQRSEMRGLKMQRS